MILIGLVNAVANLLVILVIIAVVLSYVMDPYHPVRRGVNNIVEPMLAPIRRVVPPVGVIDLSPMILILLLEFLARLISGLLSSLR